MPLTLVAPAAASATDDAVEDGLPITVPVARAGRTPWPHDGEVTWVPAALLLAAAGKCSCDDCCSSLARSRARSRLSAV